MLIKYPDLPLPDASLEIASQLARSRTCAHMALWCARAPYEPDCARTWAIGAVRHLRRALAALDRAIATD